MDKPIPDPKIAEKCMAVDRLVKEFVEDYEYYDGCGCYQPTQTEKHLIVDAIQGLLVDETFVAEFVAWKTLVAQKKEKKGGGCG